VKLSKPGEAGRELSGCEDAPKQVVTGVHMVQYSWSKGPRVAAKAMMGSSISRFFFFPARIRRTFFFDTREPTDSLVSSDVCLCSWKSMTASQL